MSALWWVELGLVPLVGRDVLRGVFWGVCEVSRTLGRLSADGWGCVPVLLVVWPEASQHWSLQAVEWGWVLVPKCQPSGELTPSNIPWGLRYPSPHPHSELQPTPTSPGDTQRPLRRSSPGSYGRTALCWVTVEVRPCVHPPRVVSLFPQPYGAPALKPHWLSRLNALEVLPPDVRSSDCLGGLFLCGNVPV